MATTTAKTKAEAEWIRSGAVSKILGRPSASIRRLAKMGAIRVRELPGLIPLYCREDVERLAAQSESGPVASAK